MASRYHLSSTFSGDLASFTPHWVVGVVRFKNQNTFDLATGESVSKDESYAMEETTNPLITTQANAVSVTSAKGSHVTNLNFSIVGQQNYLSLILPGDWVVCNMLHSEDEAHRVAGLMSQRKAVNGWWDGLKFLGRVQSVRKQVAVEPATGVRTTAYVVQAAGFSEFDSALFFHPQLVKGQTIPAMMYDFGIALTDIVKGRLGTERTLESGSVDINRVLPVLIKAVFGKGFYSNAKGISGIAGGTASPNRPFLIPATVASWLGLSANTYADILRPMLGVQHYNDVTSSNEGTVPNPWLLFKPDTFSVDDGFIKAGGDMVGLFAPSPPQFQTTVWTLLSTYLNAPVNEMYVAMRADPADGRVLPHLVVRQLPYTTDGKKVAEVLRQDAIDQEQGTSREHRLEEERSRPPLLAPNRLKLTKPRSLLNGNLFDPMAAKSEPANYVEAPPALLDVTQFQELPRWVVDPSLIYSLDVGRSDSMRFNYVHISGVGIGQSVDPIGSFVRAAPNMDELDIKRNGFRPYMTSVNCQFKDLRQGPTGWRDLMTDVVVGQHLMLSGSMTILGVLEPIAVGDNLEFENMVFHIEQVAHTARIEAGGRRFFTTTLQLSHGVLEETQRQYEGREGLYAAAHGEAAVANMPVTEEDGNG